MKNMGMFAVFITLVWGMICWLIGKLVEDLTGEETDHGTESGKYNDFC